VIGTQRTSEMGADVNARPAPNLTGATRPARAPDNGSGQHVDGGDLNRTRHAMNVTTTGPVGVRPPRRLNSEARSMA